MTGTENGLLDQNKYMAEIIKRYRKFFMMLLDAKQKCYPMSKEQAPPPDRIDLVSIEKEEYERWQAVQKIIDDAVYKDESRARARAPDPLTTPKKENAMSNGPFPESVPLWIRVLLSPAVLSIGALVGFIIWELCAK